MVYVETALHLSFTSGCSKRSVVVVVVKECVCLFGTAAFFYSITDGGSLRLLLLLDNYHTVMEKAVLLGESALQLISCVAEHWLSIIFVKDGNVPNTSHSEKIVIHLYNRGRAGPT